MQNEHVRALHIKTFLAWNSINVLCRYYKTIVSQGVGDKKKKNLGDSRVTLYPLPSHMRGEIIALEACENYSWDPNIILVRQSQLSQLLRVEQNL